VYLLVFSLLLIGQQGWGHFFRHRHLLPIGCGILQFVRQQQEKITNTTLYPFEALAASQSAFIIGK
jgi:hypothetical protein